MNNSMDQTNTQREKYLRIIKRLRPIDDTFMRKMFHNNIPLTEMVLRIITGKDDLKVIKVETQSDLLMLADARSLSLDIDATDSEGRRIDLEIQRSDRGAGVKRARYHLSAMDVNNLRKGEIFDNLPETYVIFITENDVFGSGKALYPIERINMATGKSFNDGEHIIYANGAYNGKDNIGRLMHDFRCSDPEEMYYNLMSDKAKYYKTNPKGVNEMCREMEYLRDESWNEGRNAGRNEGRKSFAALINKLLELGRNEDIKRIANDEDYRNKLFSEFGIC